MNGNMGLSTSLPDDGRSHRPNVFELSGARKRVRCSDLLGLTSCLPEVSCPCSTCLESTGCAGEPSKAQGKGYKKNRKFIQRIGYAGAETRAKESKEDNVERPQNC
jgi:hypothetical protein